MSQLPRDIRNAMATTLCVVMRARGSCGTPHCMYSHEKRKFLCPNEEDYGSCKTAYCRYRHERDSDGQALAPGESGFRTPEAVERQPTQRGEGILAATRPTNQTGGSALASKPEPRSVAAAPKAPPTAPPPPIDRWNAPDPICSSQEERDIISLFRNPMRKTVDLADLERRQMMDYATKLLNHPKPQFRRYAVREMSEPLAQTHFFDVTKILMKDESASHTFGVIIFLTRFVPLARLLGQEYWIADKAVEVVFKKFLDNILPSKLYNIYLIARGVASFIGFQGTDSGDIDWPSLYIDMLRCFLNIGKFSRNHQESAGFAACDYWLICFVEQACDVWFEEPVPAASHARTMRPRPQKEVVFDELAELVSLYNLSRFFPSDTYTKGQRRRLDDVRRIECLQWRQTGSCPGAVDESCFYSHPVSLVDKHAEKSDKKFRSMELWSKFGSRHDVITTQDLKAYWDQGLEFLGEGKAEFIFEVLMRKEGSFMIEKTLKLRTPDGADLTCEVIRSFAKIISDSRLEEYHVKENKVTIIADVFVENQKFFAAWAKDIEAGISRIPSSKTSVEAAGLIIGPVRFMLNLNPINKLEEETKKAIVVLCRVIAEHSADADVSMVEANAVAERLGLLIRRNAQGQRVEFIERDAPDLEAFNSEDGVPLVFSDNGKRVDDNESVGTVRLLQPIQPFQNIQTAPSIPTIQPAQATEPAKIIKPLQPVHLVHPNETVFGELIDTGSARGAPSTPPALHADLQELLQFGPIHFTTPKKENIKPEMFREVLPGNKLLPKNKLPQKGITSNLLDESSPDALKMIGTVAMPMKPLLDERKPALTAKSKHEDNGTKDQIEDYGPSPNVTPASGPIQCHLVDGAIQALVEFFEFGLVRPAARLAEIDNRGHFTVLKIFFISEHLYTFPIRPSNKISIFSHFLPFLDVVAHKLIKHDLDTEPGWRNIMEALFRKLWGPDEFVGFFRNSLRDFYLLHEDRGRFSSEHRKVYRKAVENMLRLLIGVVKAGQLPRIEGQFQSLMLRFLRIFSEEYRPGLGSTAKRTTRAGTIIASGSSVIGRTTMNRDPQSYHRWTKTHALINVLIAKAGLGAFFRQVPGEVGRDPQPRPLFKNSATFICPDQKLSACEFAVHCQFSHEPDDASSSDEDGSYDSDSDSDTNSGSGTERGDQTFFRANSHVGRRGGGSIVSASGDESAVSVHTMSTVIDPMDLF
ncbi:hypothetical protein TWF481_003097 [Arthrobotrys musiformis]|uniref:C3H1-type domain-containing protein n=1 Tax=Arthrobotrys musiformis TaxID=47236 RepID=A0AAV9VVM0_9PEZI